MVRSHSPPLPGIEVNKFILLLLLSRLTWLWIYFLSAFHLFSPSFAFGRELVPGIAHRWRWYSWSRSLFPSILPFMWYSFGVWSKVRDWVWVRVIIKVLICLLWLDVAKLDFKVGRKTAMVMVSSFDVNLCNAEGILVKDSWLVWLRAIIKVSSLCCVVTRQNKT